MAGIDFFFVVRVCVSFVSFSQVHVRKEGGSFGGEGGDNWCNWLVTNDTSTEHYTLPIIIERWRRIYGKRKKHRPTTKTNLMMMTVFGLTVDGDSQTEVGR